MKVIGVYLIPVLLLSLLVSSCAPVDRDRLSRRASPLSASPSMEEPEEYKTESGSKGPETEFVEPEEVEIPEPVNREDTEAEEEEPEFDPSLDLKHLSEYFGTNSQLLISRKAPQAYIQAADSIKRWIERADTAAFTIPTVYYDSTSEVKLHANTLLVGNYCDPFVSRLMNKAWGLDQASSANQRRSNQATDCGNPFAGYGITIQLIEPENIGKFKVLLVVSPSPEKILDASRHLPNIKEMSGSNMVSF